MDSTPSGEEGIGFAATTSNWYINGNIFHDIGRLGGVSYMDLDHSIYAAGANATITNNIFYNMNKGWSIRVANGAANWLIANNTFAFPSAHSGQIMLWGSITNISIINNIFYNPSEILPITLSIGTRQARAVALLTITCRLGCPA